jgi:hypothetical protein
LFLALECAEAVAAVPRSLSAAVVTIDAEGRVDVTQCDTSSETLAVRTLGQIVSALCEPLPATVREFVRRTEDGSILKVSSATSELEALLVPLNRGAARRVVARLVREVAKDPPSDRVSAPAPMPTVAKSDAPSALASSVDTEPDGAPIASHQATATVADMTPLPSKLPPPPRLGSLASLPIGPSHGDEGELHGHGDEASVEGADRTVLDGDAADRTHNDGEESLEPRRAKAIDGRKPLLFVGAFFLLAVLFFVWRVSQR